MQGVRVLLARGVPHNLVLNGQQLFLVPRRQVVHRLGRLTPGFPEVAGALICSSKEDYAQFDERVIVEHFRQDLGVPGSLLDEMLHAIMS